jgi:phosphate acyltransferase
VILKSAESLAELIARMLREELSRSVRTKAGYLLAQPAFARFKQRTDYSEYGAAPLLGVEGGCFIGHGRSSARAVQSAVRRAVEFSAAELHVKIRDKVAELRSQEERLLAAGEGVDRNPSRRETAAG